MIEPGSTDDRDDAMDSQRNTADTAGNPEPASAADLEAVRAWLRQGGHNDPAILAVAARRLIESGLLTMNWEKYG